MPEIDETEVKIEPVEDFIPIDLPVGEVDSEPNETKIEIIENVIKEEIEEINQDEFYVVNESPKLQFSQLTEDQKRTVVDLHSKGASMNEICERFNLVEMNEWCFGLKIKKFKKLMDLKRNPSVITGPSGFTGFRGLRCIRLLKLRIENR